MRLWQIDEAINDFEFEIDESTGEILNFDELDALNMERDKKVENIGLLYKNTLAEAEAIKAERDNLDERYKRKKKKADGLLNYLKFALKGKPFSTPKLECTWRSSETVEIDSEYLVPDKFVNLSIVRKPVKANIKAYLKELPEEEAKKVEWAKIVKHNNLSVK